MPSYPISTIGDATPTPGQAPPGGLVAVVSDPRFIFGLLFGAIVGWGIRGYVKKR